MILGRLANFQNSNIMNDCNVFGPLAVVLFCSGLILPGFSVVFYFIAVILGAVWVLDQCGETTTK